MAYGRDITGGNVTMHAPEGEEDRVMSLRVFKNRGCFITAWELSPEEMANVLRTGRVYVSIWGQGMPPLLVGDEDTIRLATAEGGVLPRQENTDVEIVRYLDSKWSQEQLAAKDIIQDALRRELIQETDDDFGKWDADIDVWYEFTKKGAALLK